MNTVGKRATPLLLAALCKRRMRLMAFGALLSALEAWLREGDVTLCADRLKSGDALLVWCDRNADGRIGKDELDPLTGACGERYRWALQNGFVPLPKSGSAARVQANADVFDFEISKEDMAKIAGLTGCCGFAPDPDEIRF